MFLSRPLFLFFFKGTNLSIIISITYFRMFQHSIEVLFLIMLLQSSFVKYFLISLYIGSKLQFTLHYPNRGPPNLSNVSKSCYADRALQQHYAFLWYTGHHHLGASLSLFAFRSSKTLFPKSDDGPGALADCFVTHFTDKITDIRVHLATISTQRQLSVFADDNDCLLWIPFVTSN